MTTAADPTRTHTVLSNEDVVIAMFTWWNQAFENDRFHASGFAQFFADQAEFLVNGNVRGKGPEALAAYFSGRRAEVGTAILELPFLVLFASDDQVFLEYNMYLGSAPRMVTLNAKGYARIREQRITHYTVNTFVC